MDAGQKATCPNIDSAQSKSQVAKKVEATPANRFFFHESECHPCQMQLSILDSMKIIDGLATIKYVKTTEADDQETFTPMGSRFAVVIILDKNGKEIKRSRPHS